MSTVNYHPELPQIKCYESFEFLLAMCQIPLYPPLLKGDFIVPLFDKEWLGEIFRSRYPFLSIVISSI
jgi:hypothetical protein